MPRVQPASGKDRLKELVLYVAQKCQDDPRYGAAKLAKLLFFIDFRAYAELGNSITGARYHRIERGPAPTSLLPVRKQMEADGEIKIRKVATGGKHEQERVEALRDPDVSVFSEEQRALIDAVIAQYRDMNGAQISAEAYKELGVQLAGDKEEIPYGTVYLSSAAWTATELQYAQRRMKERGWARPA